MCPISVPCGSQSGHEQQRHMRDQRLGLAGVSKRRERMVVHQPRDGRAVVDREMRGVYRRSSHGLPSPRARTGVATANSARACAGRERVAAIAELARHLDVAPLGERRLDLVAAGDAQRIGDARDRAAAAERHRARVEDPQIVVRKQRRAGSARNPAVPAQLRTPASASTADARPRRIARARRRPAAAAAAVRARRRRATRSHSRLCSCSDVAR